MVSVLTVPTTQATTFRNWFHGRPKNETRKSAPSGNPNQPQKRKSSDHKQMIIDHDQKLENLEFTEDADLDEIFDKLLSFDKTKSEKL